MIRVRAVLIEMFGLFVDDGWFALCIVAWLAVGWALPQLALPPILSCLVFGAGPPILLLASTLHRAGQSG